MPGCLQRATRPAPLGVRCAVWDSCGPAVHAARVLYTAHRVVADCLRKGKPLPDIEPLPTGVLA